ncbi:MAG: hypothetical protein PHY62_00235 [Gallionella sp.]|nr:hypothetical protein [Gallionella sp.]
MAFVNEKISAEDLAKLSSILTFEKISAQARWVPEFSQPWRWTVDRERGVYLLFLTGGGAGTTALLCVGYRRADGYI